MVKGKEEKGSGIGTARLNATKALGADFSQLQVHVGSGQVAAAQCLSALAFTRGSDIHLGPSRKNEILIAHEAVHVVQQR